MLLSSILSLAVVAGTTYGLQSFDNLVTFGDSYTDEGRLGYFINNKGAAPPAGYLQAEGSKTASGGKAWGRFVSAKTKAKYYNYAVSGAMCSNKIINRYFAPIDAAFPSVMEYQIPAFKADLAFKELYPSRESNNTVYAMWIGTNDLGFGGFSSDHQTEGMTISNYIDCIWEVFDNLYATGGRNFVLLNQAPLELSPLYASISKGGLPESQFWANKTAYNTTAYEFKMLEYTTSVNTIFDYGVPFQLIIKKRWPGASFTIFDVHKLLKDIHAKPDQYLTAPANVKDVYHLCLATDNSQCKDSSQPMSSFLWYETPLHF
jgi:phospholipase/lecithinase/hemolysin